MSLCTVSLAKLNPWMTNDWSASSAACLYLIMDCWSMVLISNIFITSNGSFIDWCSFSWTCHHIINNVLENVWFLLLPNVYKSSRDVLNMLDMNISMTSIYFSFVSFHSCLKECHHKGNSWLLQYFFQIYMVSNQFFGNSIR